MGVRAQIVVPIIWSTPVFCHRSGFGGIAKQVMKNDNLRHGGCRSSFYDLLHPAHLAIGQANLDSMWMGRGVGQDILDDPPGQLSGSLIGFQHDLHLKTGSNRASEASVHKIPSCSSANVGRTIAFYAIAYPVAGQSATTLNMPSDCERSGNLWVIAPPLIPSLDLELLNTPL